MLKRGLIISAFCFLFTIAAFAQDDQTNSSSTNTSDQVVQQQSRDLSTRLSLTPEQQARLNDVFMNYHRDISSGTDTDAQNRAMMRANSSIDEILTSSQRSQWSTLRDQWWTESNLRSNSSSSQTSGTSTDPYLRSQNNSTMDTSVSNSTIDTTNSSSSGYDRNSNTETNLPNSDRTTTTDRTPRERADDNTSDRTTTDSTSRSTMPDRTSTTSDSLDTNKDDVSKDVETETNTYDPK